MLMTHIRAYMQLPSPWKIVFQSQRADKCQWQSTSRGTEPQGQAFLLLPRHALRLLLVAGCSRASGALVALQTAAGSTVWHLGHAPIGEHIFSARAYDKKAIWHCKSCAIFPIVRTCPGTFEIQAPSVGRSGKKRWNCSILLFKLRQMQGSALPASAYGRVSCLEHCEDCCNNTNMKFGSSIKILAKRMLKYYRTSQCQPPVLEDLLRRQFRPCVLFAP